MVGGGVAAVGGAVGGAVGAVDGVGAVGVVGGGIGVVDRTRYAAGSPAQPEMIKLTRVPVKVEHHEFFMHVAFYDKVIRNGEHSRYFDARGRIIGESTHQINYTIWKWKFKWL